MLKIRPHHILCMRAYQGRGYSEDFGINMEYIIKEIGVYNKIYNENAISNRDEKVEIIFGLDSLCGKCPHNIKEENRCVTEDKVNAIDEKVVRYFNIKEGIHSYKELEESVYSIITEDIFDDICKNCGWYNVTNCKNFICE